MTDQEKQAILVQRLIDFAAGKLPCCHFQEFDELIVSGRVLSAGKPEPYVSNMRVTAATVYPVHTEVDEEDCDAAKTLMIFKVWCSDNDSQIPTDDDNRLWFDFSAPDTEVAVLVKIRDVKEQSP